MPVIRCTASNLQWTESEVAELYRNKQETGGPSERDKKWGPIFFQNVKSTF
jgi:hypothetical protein